jgi:uncharacterized protein YlxW (UPF0749 family)
MHTMPDDEPRRSSRKGGAWVVQVTGLSLALGIMLALAIRTQDHIRRLGLPANRHGVSPVVLSYYNDQNMRLEKEIQERQNELRDIHDKQKSKSDSDGQFQKKVEELRALAGYAPVEGPGLRLVLRDSPRQVQPGTPPNLYWVSEADLNGLVFELRAAGAEALSISELGGKNAQRFILSTTIQATGRDMLVNGVTLHAPFELRAIGNPKELRAALEMPDGIVDNRGLGPDVLQMLTIEEDKHLVLPAYVPSRGPSSPAAPDE